MLFKEGLLKKLTNSNIDFKLYEHDALYTVNDSEVKRGNIKGGHTKNLFLKNKKNSFFLLSCLENAKIDLKKIGKALKIGNLSFANKDYLVKYLGVQPGSVSPFGLLNDTENISTFYLDSQLLDFEHINFHPLINTSTITVNTSSFINFLIENNKKVNIFNFKTYNIEE